MHGWAGTILKVDLSEKKYEINEMDPILAKNYLGGQGTASKVLFDEIDPKVDGLSPENILIFSTGPLTGTGAVTGSRGVWASKSPLSGGIAFSNCGGYFPAEVKFAGYDMIILGGKADKPVYLIIEDDKVLIKDARGLWGKTVSETGALIRAEIDDPIQAMDTRIACIGPAGENLVKISSIISDYHRAAARCGIGAVMGSKNLKAVVVRGTKGLTVADQKGFMKAVGTAIESSRTNPVTSETFPLLGSAAGVTMFNSLGILPNNNFQKMATEQEAYQISGEKVSGQYLIRNRACFGCPIGCGGPLAVEGERPEYETHALLAASCGVYDAETLIRGTNGCNEFGIDTIDMGGAVATAMELFEKGLLPEKDAGEKLNFGNGEAMVRLIEQTAYRKGGIGELIAEGGGSLLAEKYGSPDSFVGVKNMAFSGYDPRNANGMGLGVVTSVRGACHNRAYTIYAEVMGIPEYMDPLSTEGKAFLVKYLQDMQAGILDAVGVCTFSLPAQPPDLIFEQLAAATGAGHTFEEVLKIGERIWNLQQLFNLRAGLSGADNRLPKRFLEEPAPGGAGKGSVVDFEPMLKEYYEVRGWNENGVPTQEKLNELGLQ
jgi:aldehyde:ferredoxin oxidoreductase